MKVTELARLLDGLGHGLDGVVAAAVVNDLRSFQSALLPFADRTVADFTRFLAQCEEYQRTGVVAGGRRASTAKRGADPELVANAASRFRELLGEVDRGTVTSARIDALMASYNKLTKPQLDEVSATVGIAGKAKTKAQAIDRLRQVLRSQAEMHVKARS